MIKKLLLKTCVLLMLICTGCGTAVKRPVLYAGIISSCQDESITITGETKAETEDASARSSAVKTYILAEDVLIINESEENSEDPLTVGTNVLYSLDDEGHINVISVYSAAP